MRGYTASTYGDRIAGVYDSFYRQVNVSERIDILSQLVAGGRVLELGIGTGTYALPLVGRGVEVHGIDSSEAMVDQLRAKGGGETVPVTIGDFADVDVEGTFSLIFVISNTFFMLTSQEEQVRCFANVASHAWQDFASAIGGPTGAVRRLPRRVPRTSPSTKGCVLEHDQSG